MHKDADARIHKTIYIVFLKQSISFWLITSFMAIVCDLDCVNDAALARWRVWVSESEKGNTSSLDVIDWIFRMVPWVEKCSMRIAHAQGEIIPKTICRFPLCMCVYCVFAPKHLSFIQLWRSEIVQVTVPFRFTMIENARMQWTFVTALFAE